MKSDKNVETILDQDEKSRELIKNLDNISKSLPKDLSTSRDLTKDTEHGIKDINQSNKQCKLNIKIKIIIRFLCFNVVLSKFSGDCFNKFTERY